MSGEGLAGGFEKVLCSVKEVNMGEITSFSTSGQASVMR